MKCRLLLSVIALADHPSDTEIYSGNDWRPWWVFAYLAEPKPIYVPVPMLHYD